LGKLKLWKGQWETGAFPSALESEKKKDAARQANVIGYLLAFSPNPLHAANQVILSRSQVF
jgi:hypothetical protein